MSDVFKMLGIFRSKGNSQESCPCGTYTLVEENKQSNKYIGKMYSTLGNN